MKYARTLLIALLAIAASVAGGVWAAPGVNQRVSVSTSGAEANGGSGIVDMSPDGRYVAFTSLASNLIAGDTNGVRDVFVRDRYAGVTERVSVDAGGTESNASSFGARISSNGRYVTFWSAATNLVSGDTNATDDVFLKDRTTGAVERISISALGVQGNGSSTTSALSADARYVAFSSTATNLVAGDANGKQDVFVRDRRTGAVERISVTDRNSVGADLSSDGRFVSFQASDAAGYPDIYLHDRQTATTITVTAGAESSQLARISANGQFVTFTSLEVLAPPEAVQQNDVFVYDRLTAAFELVSKDSAGTPSNSSSGDSTISADGRYVTFTSFANLSPPDYNVADEVSLRDRLTGTTTMLRNSIGGQGTPIPGPVPAATNDYPTISDDGSMIVFAGDSCNYVAGDTNDVADIFLWNVNGGGPPLPDMDGDGVTNGCDNCPAIPNADQADATGDGQGDVCQGAPAYLIDNLSLDAEDDAAPANSAASIVSTETCRRINNNGLLDADEDAVDTLTIDITVGPIGIPTEAPVNGFEFTLSYGGAHLQIAGNDVYQLLSSAAGSTIVNGSDAVPDSDGSLYVFAFDTAAAADETGDGVLARITVEGVNSGPVLAPLTLAAEAITDSSSEIIPIGDVNNAWVALDASCNDGDGDSVPDFADNCPNDPNPDQADNEGDGLGDVCDADDDNAGVYDVDEIACGGNPMVAALRPERTDAPFAGVDDDGDTQVDEALASGTSGYDCDGDGYTGTAEDHVFFPGAAGNQDACGNNGWPADLAPAAPSANKITLTDLTSFISMPRRLGTSPGDPAYNVRWDVVPGSPGGPTIHLVDLTSVATTKPPMLDGVRAFGGPACPWAP